MKNTSILLFLIIAICFSSCRKEGYKKPEDLIDENTMSDILYELAIFYAAKNLNSSKLDKNRLNPQTFIYDRFGIDSTQFANSSVYYASKPSVNIDIYKRVEERLKLENERLENVAKEKVKKDSIENVLRNKKLKDSTGVKKP